MPDTITDRLRYFTAETARTAVCGERHWRYFRLGDGSAVVILPGGLRRVAFGFEVIQRIAAHHAVIALDLPPLASVAEFVDGVDRIMTAEGITRAALIGQSYGGLVAQAYVARRPERVTRLILTSTGPADYGRAWLPFEYAAAFFTRVLPTGALRRALAAFLPRAFTVPASQRRDWMALVRRTLLDDLTDDDVISHFMVIEDMIRARVVRRGAYTLWAGDVVVLAATNDPTQRRRDVRRRERLFGRRVKFISLGRLGHTAPLMNPAAYADHLERALGAP